MATNRRCKHSPLLFVQLLFSVMTDIIIIIQVYVQTTLEDGVLLQRYCRRVVRKEVVVVFIIIIIIVIKTNKQSSCNIII